MKKIVSLVFSFQLLLFCYVPELCKFIIVSHLFYFQASQIVFLIKLYGFYIFFRVLYEEMLILSIPFCAFCPNPFSFHSSHVMLQ